jgi:hypothetical protein
MTMEKKAQVSIELVMMAAMALGILLVIYLSNNMVSSSWENEKQRIEASFAADRMALSIGRAVAGGDGTVVRFFNRVGPDIVGFNLTYNRSISVRTVGGLRHSAPLVTSNISAPGGIPANAEITITNSNGQITIREIE